MLDKRKMHLYIAKINVDMSVFYNTIDEALDIIKRNLMEHNGEVVRLRDATEWAFAETGKVVVDGKTLIAGRLGRRKPRKKTDLSDGRFVSGQEPDWVYSNFVFFSKEELIIFEERKGDISITSNQFRRRFVELCIYFSPELGEVELETKKDLGRIQEQLAKADKIYAIQFTIFRPNPSDKPEWSAYLDDLDQSNASRIKKIYESAKGGINHLSSSIQTGLDMVSNAYGSYRAKVEKNGKPRTLESKNFEYRVSTETDDQPERFAPKAFSLFSDFFNINKREHK